VDPIETLANEHGLIRKFLDHLRKAGEEIEEGKRPPRAFFEKGVEFARTFADAFHHIKEEHVLFVRLAQKRQGEVDGQIEALRFQHERGRSLVKAMADSIDGYAEGDAADVTRLLEAMSAYVSLLRHHIHTEDHIFFPAAREALDDDDLEALSEAFELEQQKYGGDTFERSHKLLVDMNSMLVHTHI